MHLLCFAPRRRRNHASCSGKKKTKTGNDGRLLLRFNDKGFQDPFYSQQMSDGTLKVFAYLLLLEDPTPPPFLCIEEPENGLYHKNKSGENKKNGMATSSNLLCLSYYWRTFTVCVYLQFQIRAD
jgi:hypothetical protein